MNFEDDLRKMIRAEIKAAIGGNLKALKATVKGSSRSPGRPKKKNSNAVACGIKGCARDARCKGYCSAHYQKFNALKNKGELPAEWIENPQPDSVENVAFRRGRPAAGQE